LSFIAYRRRFSRRLALFALAVLAVGFTLGARVFDEVLSGPIAPLRSLEAMALPYTGFAFVAGFGMGPSVAELHRSLPWQSALGHWPEVAAVAVVGLVLVITGLRTLRSGCVSNVCLVAWIFIPPLVAFGVSAASGVTYNVRYSIAALPAFALFASRGLLSLPAVARVLLCIALAAISAFSLIRTRSHPDYVREDLRAAGAFLAGATTDGDWVVVSARYLDRVLGHYYLPGRSVYPLPLVRIATSHDASATLNALADRPESVWLVLAREWDEDPGGFLRAELKARRIPPAFQGNGVILSAYPVW
jgi:hypothetical protein